jgi:hypothetical protein
MSEAAKRPTEQQAYDQYWARHMDDPEFRALYDKEAAKKNSGCNWWKPGKRQG